MKTETRDRFIELWERYFPGASLPVTFGLIDDGEKGVDAERLSAGKGHRCLVCDLAKARKGRSVILNSGSITCSGGRFYTGYEKERFPDFGISSRAENRAQWKAKGTKSTLKLSMR